MIAKNTTSLHLAVERCSKEIAENIITNGANVNAKNNNGRTPLDIATNPENLFKTEEFIELLRKHGGKTSKELKTEGK